MQKFFDCGIDLGTTNSCIAYPTEGDKCCIVENIADRMQVTPSAVAYVRGRYIVGRRALGYPGALTCFKRKMGTNDTLSFADSDVSMTPEQLSTEILKALKRDAEARMYKDVKDVIITVPAAFSSLQNEATKNAAKLSGFREVILLQEPIAAAIAYGVRPDVKNQYWMVFDYGGGTIDVSILSTFNSRLTVINSEGDNYCGGSDIDRLIFDTILSKEISKEYDISNNNEIAAKLKDLCETCKIELSSSDKAIIEVFDIEDNNKDLIECECVVTRKQLEELIYDTVNRCVLIAKKAVEGAKQIDPNCKLNKILLVGGSTFIPLVRKRLQDEFSVELDCSLNPMTVVAEGAAIYAGTCTTEVAETNESHTSTALVVNLQYEPVTSSEFSNIIGTVTNCEGLELGRIKINAESENGTVWTSGWVDFIDETVGVFDIDVKIYFFNSNNKYFIKISDKTGKEIEVLNNTFEIKHSENSLKMSAPPATMSICVMVNDDDNNILVPVIKKNSPLPAEATKTFRTTKELKPDVEDTIDIHIWEGEEFSNPQANNWIGCVHIQSSAMRCTIPTDTDVEITIMQDESRTNYITGYIPYIDYVIPEETLRNKDERVSVIDRMEEIEKQFNQLEMSIKKLKNYDVNIAEFELEYNRLLDEFEEIYDSAETDSDRAQLFIKRFYEVHTAILTAERDYNKSHEDDSAYELIINCKSDIAKYGDSSQVKEYIKLELAYNKETNNDNKQYYIDQIIKLRINVITNSFEWLGVYGAYLMYGAQTVYTDEQKAEYWKTQFYLGYSEKNIAKMRKALFQLIGLSVSSANDTINALRADLKL